MKIYSSEGKEYKLPGTNNQFQKRLYVHLINWKWAHGIREPGKINDIEYDAALPDSVADQRIMLYPRIAGALDHHLARYAAPQHKFGIRVHIYFNHMASSQAANINLFLPILMHPKVNAILASVKHDLARVAESQLDHGYRLEYWDEPSKSPEDWEKHPGNLRDKKAVSGTDADIAIAYYNHQDELCLWLIEHKLAEKDFTPCGGYAATRKEQEGGAAGFKTTGKKKSHRCDRRFQDYLDHPQWCYYHDVCHYEYWNITKRHSAFFASAAKYPRCPFHGGMNQLWRNQLLGLAIERDERQPFRHVTFSVVKHPRNTALDRTLNAYRELIANHLQFSVLTSAEVLAAAAQFRDAELGAWIDWYRSLYDL